MATFTTGAGHNVFTGTTGTNNTVNTTIGHLHSTDTLDGGGPPGVNNIQFLNAGGIAASSFDGVTGFEVLDLAAGNNNLNFSNYMLSQAAAFEPGAVLTVDAVSGQTSFNLLAVTAGQVVLNGGNGTNVFQVNASELPNVTIHGVAGFLDRLALSGGGDVDLRQDNVSLINIVSLNGPNAYFLTLQAGATVYMGTNADTVVVGADGGNSFNFGAAGQDAIGGAGNDVFGMTAATYNGSTINGGAGFNTLSLTGGGTFDLADINATSIQRVVFDNNSVHVDADVATNDWSNVNGLQITAGNGNDQIDLSGFSAIVQGPLSLKAGNGNDIVELGDNTQSVTLGNGTNLVLVSGADLDGNGGLLRPGFTPAINGGTGTGTQTVGNDSLNTLVVTDNGGGDPVMSNKIVGFHAVDLGFYDGGSDLSFFGLGSGPYYNFFDDDATFVANNTAGLVVYGTEYGGDTITLNTTDQSYIDGAGGNLVQLNAGGLTAAQFGTELNGGGGGGNTLELTSDGTYNFLATGVSVSNFQTVQIDLNAIAVNLDLNGSNYTVNIEGPNGGAATDDIVGGTGNDTFSFFGTGSFAGTVDGGGGTNAILINSGATTSLVGLTTLSNVESIHIDDTGTLTVTSAQLAALETNPNWTGVVDDDGATLNIDVVGRNFNLADLKLQSFGDNTITIIDNNLGDTIYGGPQDNQMIVLGTGNDWINAGSGDTTVIASFNSGQNAVLIGGDGNDTFMFGTPSQTMLTDDTIIGPQPTGSDSVSGQLTVEIVAGSTVDFTGGTFGGFPDIEYVNTIQIDDGATAIFTLEQLAGLGTNNPGLAITDQPATLEIVADSSTNNTVTLGDLYGYTGQLLIDVTGFSNNSGAPVLIAVTGLTNNVTIDANSGFETINLDNATDVVNVGNGVESITGGTGNDTAVFDIANFQTTDTFIGNNGSYTFEVEANTDFTAATFSGSYTSPISVEIGPSVIVRLAASDLAAVPGGVSVGTNPNDNYAVNNGHLYVDLSNAVDTASNIPAGKDTTTFDQADVTVGANIDETIYGSNNSDTITLDALGLRTSVFDGSGADHITFTVNLSQTLADTINGGTGQNTLELGGGTSGTPVTDDFRGSTLTQISIEQIDPYDTGIFYSPQVDGSTANVDDNATFSIYVQNESLDGSGREFFSLQNVAVGPITGSANLLLNLINSGTGVVNIFADANGDDIVAGIGTENVTDGGGGDHIQAGQNTDNVNVQYGFASAAVADQVFGWSAAGGTLSVNFDNTQGGTTDQFEVQGTLATFSADPVTVNGEQETAGTTLYIEANTDLTGATISHIAAIQVDNAHVATPVDLVVTDGQLAAFAGAGVLLTTLDTGSALTIDVTNATFAPASAMAADLNGWTGSVTIEGGSGNQTIDAHGLDTNTFTPDDLYIYGLGGNDTITGTNDGGDHLFGGGGNDTFQFRGGDGLIDVVGGGGGTNTIELTGADTGTVDFSDFANYNAGSIANIQEVQFDASSQANLTMIVSDPELVGDQASLALGGTGPLALSDAGGNHDYTFQVDATGNVDVSGVDVTGFVSVGGTFRSVLYVDDDNTGSVTVYGSNNGLLPATATAGTLPTDILQVQGFGDTVRAGTGATEAIFQNYNVANSFQYDAADLGHATANNGNVPLALEGDLVRGLADGAEVIDGSSGHRGYVDLTGFAGVNAAVNTSPTHNIDLGGANGFANYGVVEDNDIITQTFITGGTTGGTSTPNNEHIFAAGVGLAAGDIEGIHANFTDSATNKGFVTVWDDNSDFALFYVNHNATTNGSAIKASEVQLVGVFDTVDGFTPHDSGSNKLGTLSPVPVLSQLFFHIH